jgi:hypothetical protein
VSGKSVDNALVTRASTAARFVGEPAVVYCASMALVMLRSMGRDVAD